MSCLKPVSLNACWMERQGSLPEMLADSVFPCGFNSRNTETARIFLAIYVVLQRGLLTNTYHWVEIKMATTETAEGRGAVHASHCRRTLWFFLCKLRVGLDSQPSPQPPTHGISEMSVCVKITSGLCCSHSSMFLHKDRGTRPCLCSGDRSAFMSDITLHRPGQVGGRVEDRGSMFARWTLSAALPSGQAALNHWADCSWKPSFRGCSDKNRSLRSWMSAWSKPRAVRLKRMCALTCLHWILSINNLQPGLLAIIAKIPDCILTHASSL